VAAAHSRFDSDDEGFDSDSDAHAPAYERAASGYSSGEETDDGWAPALSDAEEAAVTAAPTAAAATVPRPRPRQRSAFAVWRSAHRGNGGAVRAEAHAGAGDDSEALFKAASPRLDVLLSAAGQRFARECAAAAEASQRTGRPVSVSVDCDPQRGSTVLLVSGVLAAKYVQRQNGGAAAV
jgi:hypothetical protein